MQTTILYTTETKGPSKAGLQWVTNLAGSLNAHLTILQAFRLISQKGHEEIIEEKKEFEQKARDQFLQLEREILSSSGVSYEFKTEVGFAIDRIRSHIKKNKVEFLVIDNSNTEILENIARGAC